MNKYRQSRENWRRREKSFNAEMKRRDWENEQRRKGWREEEERERLEEARREQEAAEKAKQGPSSWFPAQEAQRYEEYWKMIRRERPFLLRGGVL